MGFWESVQQIFLKIFDAIVDVAEYCFHYNGLFAFLGLLFGLLYLGHRSRLKDVDRPPFIYTTDSRYRRMVKWLPYVLTWPLRSVRKLLYVVVPDFFLKKFLAETLMFFLILTFTTFVLGGAANRLAGGSSAIPQEAPGHPKN